MAGEDYSSLLKTTGYAACQNCGRPVRVLLPFVGCVFCRDCSISGWSSEANAPEFKYPYQEVVKDEE